MVPVQHPYTSGPGCSPNGLAPHKADNDQYISASDKLCRAAKAQLVPFTTRRFISAVTNIGVTFAMALLTYVVLTSVLSFPIVIAFLTALVVQMVGIYLTHGHFETVRATDNRFSWYFWAAVAASCVMLAIAYLRAQMYVQDMDINPVVACIVSLLVATIEPGATWVLGAMTAGAQSAFQSRREILVRAANFKEAIAATARKDATWRAATDFVQAEIESVKHNPMASVHDIARRNEQIALLQDWLRLLNTFYPNHGTDDDAD